MKYFDYFKDELAYPEIQDHGPAAMQAEIMGRGLDKCAADSLAVRDQFMPETVHPLGLIHHGRGRGIERHEAESDSQFKTRVLYAFDWAMKSGRFKGMHDIFAAYGFPVIKLEELDGGHWAEFDLFASAPNALDEKTWRLVFWLAGTEYKRATARLRTLRLVKEAEGFINIKAAPLIGEKITLYPLNPEPEPAQGSIYFGAAAVSYERWTLGGNNEQ